jgi:hypothetical protein
MIERYFLANLILINLHYHLGSVLSHLGHLLFNGNLAHARGRAENTKGGSITVPSSSCLTGLESAV